MRERGRPELLPSPGVRFRADFLARAGLLAARLSAARERREGPGRAALLGAGAEFVGFRPYRPGEDARQIDWPLFARLGKPFVRISRREASERWTVLLDASASMGVGVPGKLQRAAEVAAALAVVALRGRFELEVLRSGSSASFRVRRRSDLGALLQFLEGSRAEGRAGLAALLAERARLRQAGALFALGDLFDLEPADVFRAARAGQSLYLLQILAREELVPPPGPVRWVDAEGGEARSVDVDRSLREAYEGRLGRTIEAWSAAARRRRAFHGCWLAAAPFERIVRATLAGGFG